MENIIKRLVLDDTREPDSYDDHESSEIQFESQSVPVSQDIDNFHNNESESSVISDSLVQQRKRPISNNQHKYRIHIGTQPGYYTNKHITFEESQHLHCIMIAVLEDFLKSSNVSYEFIRKDAFSNSAWGLEPYACILLSCSNEMAEGLAALIGLALRQDAIGVYSDNDDDGFPHSVFTVLPLYNSLILDTDALHIMKIINKYYEALSAQFDEHGQVLEFHDFGNKYDRQTTRQQLMKIINDYFENVLFEVEESIGKSDLLEKIDYEEAIKQAGLVQLSHLIKLTLLSGDLYNKPKSLGKNYIHHQIRKPRY